MSFEASSTWLLPLSSVLFLTFYLLRRVFRLKLVRGCGCEICHSFLSSSWSMKFHNLCDWYSHLLSESPTGTIHVHVLNNVITANPANVEYILKTRFENYPKGEQFREILGDLLGEGIFNVDGDLWKFQRKMASLELGNASVRSFGFDVVVAEIQSRLIPLFSSFASVDLDHGVAGNGPFLDLQDVFRRFSFDSVCKFSFGLDPGCLDLSLPVSEFELALDLASNLSARRAICPSPWIWKIKRFFNLGPEKQLKKAIKIINNLVAEMINVKRNSDISSNQDLLSRFMRTIEEDDEFLRDIVVSFLLAGRDTVASALTTFFWLLSRNPAATALIREESDRIMGKYESHKTASFEQLKEMHYLQAAIHEGMRLFPPVQFDSKFCREDDILPDGTFVAKGSRVTYHPYAMGRMERIWGGDCAEFKPERWLRNGVFRRKNPFEYAVFQAGPRVCLGKEMAVVEMATVAVSLIRKFDVIVAAPPNECLRFSPGLTATVKGGLLVSIRERKH